jgi:hypothetical protein
MTETVNEKRMAQNEATFREFNQKAQKAIDEVNQIAAEDNGVDQYFDEQMPLHFVCECGNEKCTKRIQLTLDEYNAAHTDERTFTIAPGHEIPSIEDLIEQQKKYSIVRKHVTPQKTQLGLAQTQL